MLLVPMALEGREGEEATLSFLRWRGREGKGEGLKVGMEKS